MHVATRTISDAVSHLRMMSDEDRLDIFKHIDLMLLKYEQTNDAPKKKRTVGTLAGKVVFAPDFDEPLDDFKEYM